MGRLPPRNTDSRASATIASSGGGDPPKRLNNSKSGSGMGHYNERYRVSKTYRPKDQRPDFEGVCYRCQRPRHGNGQAASCRHPCACCGKEEHFGTFCPGNQTPSQWKRHAGGFRGQTNRNKGIIEGLEEDLSNARVQNDALQENVDRLLSRCNNADAENGRLRAESGHSRAENGRLRAENERLRAQLRNQNAPLPSAWATEYPPGPPTQDLRSSLGQQQQSDQYQVPQQHTPLIAYQGHSDHGHPQTAPPHQRVPPQPATGPDRQEHWRPWTPPPADTNAHASPSSGPENTHQQGQTVLPLRQGPLPRPRTSQGNVLPSHALFNTTPLHEHQDMARPQLAGSGPSQPCDDDDDQERHKPTRR